MSAPTTHGPTIETTAPAVAMPGPRAPQPGLPPLTGPRMSTFPASTGHLYVVGAHGGAGETTIAAWTGARASSGRWPVSASWPPGGQPRPDGGQLDVVLVARTHAPGLTAAGSVLTQWASGRLPANRLHGLILIPDAPGRLPKPLADLALVVAGGAPRSWLLPWLDPLRLLADPSDATSAEMKLPRPVLRFTRDLQGLSATTTPTT